MPPTIQGSRRAASRVCRRESETPPISFMPRESIESPMEANTETPASTSIFFETSRFSLSFSPVRLLRATFLFLAQPTCYAWRASSGKPGFLVEPLAIAAVERGLAQDAERGFATGNSTRHRSDAPFP